MIDQRVSEGEKINFFGKPAYTTTLPAQLSKKYNLDIIPVYIERINEGKFQIEFQNIIKPENFRDKIELSEKLNKVLENDRKESWSMDLDTQQMEIIYFFKSLNLSFASMGEK